MDRTSASPGIEIFLGMALGKVNILPTLIYVTVIRYVRFPCQDQQHPATVLSMIYQSSIMPTSDSSASPPPSNSLPYSDLRAPGFPDPERMIPAGLLSDFSGPGVVSPKLSGALDNMPSDIHSLSIDASNNTDSEHAFMASELEEYELNSNQASNSSDDGKPLGLGSQGVDQQEDVSNCDQASSSSTAGSIIYTPASSHNTHTEQVEPESFNDLVIREFARIGQTMPMPFGFSRFEYKAWRAGMTEAQFFQAESIKYRRTRSRYAEFFKAMEDAKIGQLSNQDFDLLDLGFNVQEVAGNYYHVEVDNEPEPLSDNDLSGYELSGYDPDLSDESSDGSLFA